MAFSRSLSWHAYLLNKTKKENNLLEPSDFCVSLLYFVCVGARSALTDGWHEQMLRYSHVRGTCERMRADLFVLTVKVYWHATFDASLDFTCVCVGGWGCILLVHSRRHAENNLTGWEHLTHLRCPSQKGHTSASISAAHTKGALTLGGCHMFVHMYQQNTNTYGFLWKWNGYANAEYLQNQQLLCNSKLLYSISPFDFLVFTVASIMNKHEVILLIFFLPYFVC